MKKIVKYIVILLVSIFSYQISFGDNYLRDYKSPRFERFAQKILPELNNFSNTNLSNFSDRKSILYPFGGPDVIYPLVLFPNAEIYTLIGLERTGKDTSCLSKVSPKTLDKQLESLLRRSFFVTFDMNRYVSAECGVLPMLIAQLNMLNCKIMDFNYLDLSFGNSIEIKFNHLGKEKKLIYLKANLQNEHISDDLIDYIKNNKLLDACILKAGSYNLHKKEFTKIKDFLTDNADVILQDDTGVPLAELRKNFSIKLFGNYIAPFGKEWVGFHQRALVDMYKSSQPVDKLKFCYGYGCSKVMPAIIIAEKNKE